jgi:hypothetical protein
MESNDELRWYHDKNAADYYDLRTNPMLATTEIAYIDIDTWSGSIKLRVWLFPNHASATTIATYKTLEQALEDASKVFDVSPKVYAYPEY